MAISIKNQAKYDRLYDELKLNMAGSYASEVRILLAQKSIEITERQVYNVVRHHKQDFDILFALREHFNLVPDPDEENNKKRIIKSQKLNAPPAA